VLARRQFLLTSGLWLASVTTPRVVRGASVTEVKMRSDARGERVWFDPVGLLVQPGATVRWVMDSPGNPHTTTAYHPKNAKHSLRIPEHATPWDSGFLVTPGQHFDVTFREPGVYDYFCLPHEAAGMVGRLIVGKPGGPGAQPFDYFVGRADAADWTPVPAAARATFPSVAAIMAQRVVRLRVGA
jgi:plastocyanin